MKFFYQVWRIPVWGRVAAWIVFVLIAASAFSIIFWDWLGEGESSSATIRNIFLAVAAAIGLPLAIWRGAVADRQARAAHLQVETSQRQVRTSQRQSDTAQQGLLNERYQKGAEMLGSAVLSVRLGGIYALARLADEHPEKYHVPIIQLFCTYARNPTESEGGQAKPKNRPGRESTLQEDIQAVMTAIGSRSKAGLGYEEATKSSGLEITHRAGPEGGECVTVERVWRFWLDLRGAKLRGVDLCEADLSHANFNGADLSNSKLLEANLAAAIIAGADVAGAYLWRANLTGANLWSSDLSGANLASSNLSNAKLVYANLSKATLSEANLTDADLHHVTGLTQARLDQACADPDHPPSLHRALDAETGKRLVWQGKPLNN